jgi:tRNA threonylcarbamoyladenosine biosynthesis protein TsaB
MKILAFDTALDACSAALWSDGTVLAWESAALARGHAEILFPMLGRVLGTAGADYADIGRFAVTIGPGSFTGVRVGVAAARGLALARGVPAVGITTLEAIAATAISKFGETAHKVVKKVAAAIDAKRGEIYIQIFDTGREDGVLVALTPPSAVTPEGAARLIGAGPVLLAGSGSVLVRAALEDLAEILDAEAALVPDAGLLAGIAARRAVGADMPPPSPLYLRAPDAKLPAPVRAGAP